MLHKIEAHITSIIIHICTLSQIQIRKELQVINISFGFISDQSIVSQHVLYTSTPIRCSPNVYQSKINAVSLEDFL